MGVGIISSGKSVAGNNFQKFSSFTATDMNHTSNYVVCRGEVICFCRLTLKGPEYHKPFIYALNLP